jgi:hypothetical protein
MLRPAFGPRGREENLVEKLVRKVEIPDAAADADDDRDQPCNAGFMAPSPRRCAETGTVSIAAPAGAGPGSPAGPRVSARRDYFSASQLFWISGCDILRGLAAGVVDHAGPERPGADGAGHQVGGVEAEGGGVQQDLALTSAGRRSK